MSTRGPGQSTLAAAASVGFVAGLITMALLIWGLGTRSWQRAPAVEASAEAPSLPSFPAAPPIASSDAVRELRGRQLEIPVRGVARRDLRNAFDEARDATRTHEAMDILAPRNTPVLAVEDGTIAKLFESKLGGTTVYQFDPASRYTYYYAHLERYADGLREGNHVARGQVIGYVGTSGNAPKNTPHLHFAVFKLTEQKQWWQGTPINPFEIFRAP